MKRKLNYCHNQSNRSFQKKSSIQLPFPDKDGNIREYEIQEASIMHPDLQKKYPNIRSYIGTSIDGKRKIRFSISPKKGLEGVISSKKGEIQYLKPSAKNNLRYAISPKKETFLPQKRFACKTTNLSRNIDTQKKTNRAKRLNTDGKLRTFRLALACTGEYAQFHLNDQGIPQNASKAEKKEAILAAMNTTITRVNSVFERDVGIKMQLIENNDTLIFLDKDTDPFYDLNVNNDYTDGFLEVLASSPDIFNKYVGHNSYDIAHVVGLSNEGSGIAEVASVCTNKKAMGVSAAKYPKGDLFDIDYVSHEIGHQFGASHTFSNYCGGEITSNLAVEPGSGSTIMAYAGICSPNIQQNSDGYFHAINIEQMYTNITKGLGNCALKSDIGNLPPIADAGDDFIIPRATPFVLKGKGTGATDKLTYCWEQTDGQIAAMPPLSTNRVGPLFRSLSPSTFSERYFPKLETILNNQLGSEWEQLPDIERILNFKLTLRDNAISGGQIAIDDMKIAVARNSGPFAVTSQNTKELVNVGQKINVTWNVANTNSPPVNATRVNILLSLDGGLSFPITLASKTANDGLESVVVPNHITTKARLKVEADKQIFFNINQANFEIDDPIILKIPKGFSPNSDGINDLWKISAEKKGIALEELPKITVKIYTRSGELIYTSSDYKNDWNGISKKGNKIPTGTYLYSITSNNALFPSKREWLYVKY